MACGDKYRYLIRNDKGKTWEDPCDLFCGELDYASWHKAATELAPRVLGQWGNLSRLEFRQDESTPIATGLREQVGAYEAATRELISPSRALLFESGLTMSGLVDQAVAVMGEGACALELIETGFSEIGERAPEIPAAGRYPEDRGKGGTILGALGGVVSTVAVVGVLAGAGWLAWKYSKRPAVALGAEA